MRYVTFSIPESAFRRMFMPLIEKEVSALLAKRGRSAVAEHRRGKVKRTRRSKHS